MNKYDSIIIGAGNGGLITAATLAGNGQKVLLLEQHNLPGGFATSFIRGRFEFEPALHELSDYRNEEGDGLNEIFDKLHIEVNWKKVPEAYRLIITDSPDGKIDCRMPFGIKEYIDAIDAEVPGNRAVIEKFFALIEELAEGLAYAGNGKPSISAIMKKYGNFVKVLPYTVEEVENALGIPNEVKAILNAYWCYLGVDTARLDFFIYAMMIRGYLKHGAIVPSQRSHEISSLLERRILTAGGEIRYNTQVTKIIVENGIAKGVETKHGEIYADNIISNASPTIVFSSLIDQDKVPPIEIKRSNAREKGGQGFSVYLGLNKSPEELGFEDYSYFIYPTGDSASDISVMRRAHGRKIIAATCLNKAVPDCSPKGTTIFSITTLFFGNALNDINEKNYFQEKTAIAQELITAFEKATGIAIRPYIEEISIATPATYARYTGAYNGCIYGYDLIPEDSVVIRTLRDKKERTVANLYFVGGSAVRAHGYSSSYIGGYLVANEIIGKPKKSKEGK